MSPLTASEFANTWIAAWNARDLSAVLAHYADDCVLHTPIAQWLLPSTRGVLVGKPAMAAYWAKALQRPGDWRFALTHVHTGVNSLGLAYEFCFFNAQHLVCLSHVLYAPERLQALFKRPV
jgi:hypothetical protein